VVGVEGEIEEALEERDFETGLLCMGCEAWAKLEFVAGEDKLWADKLVLCGLREW